MAGQNIGYTAGATYPPAKPVTLPTMGGTGTPMQGLTSQPPIGVNPNYNAFIYSQNGQPVYWDVSSAKKRFDILNKAQQDNLIASMDNAYGKGQWKYADMRKGWDAALDMSASYKAAYGQDVSVFDTFAARAKANAANGMTMGGRLAGGGSGGASSSISKSVQLTDPTTARGLIDNTLSTYLGRKANAKEQEAFLKALNVQEQRNPTITKTNSFSGKGSSSSSSTTTGGFSPATFAQEWAAGQEGAGEFQAATSLLDTFIKSIGETI